MRTIKKYSWIVILLTVICLNSCRKTKLKGEYEPLVGEWIWISSTGGGSGYVYTPISESFSRKIILYKDGSFKAYKNEIKAEVGSVIVNSNYIEFRQNILSKPKNEFFFLSYENFKFIDANTICFTDKCADCFSHIFKRK